MLRTHAGLRGRLLQCWVKNQGSGFTARDWIACKEGFRWMEEGALRDFCSRLGELRTLVRFLAFYNFRV